MSPEERARLVVAAITEDEKFLALRVNRSPYPRASACPG